MRVQSIFTATLLFALIASATPTTAKAQDERPRRSGWRDRVSQNDSGLKHFEFRANQRFASQALGGQATYSIYLPKDYEAEDQKTKRYPVIYFLHGMREDHNRFHQRGGAAVLDELAGEKALPPLIFVCVFDGSQSSFYVNSRRAKVEDMIVKDLIAHVDGAYRTEAKAASRAVLGISMGGFGAMKIAFKHPSVFAAVATHSAAILPEKYEEVYAMFPWASRYRLAETLFGDPVDQKLWAAESPLVLARTVDAKELAKLRIYFDCGDQDRYEFDTTNAQMHEILTARKVKHHFQLVKDGGHGWNTRRSEVGYNNANLPHSLRFLATCFAAAKGNKALEGALASPPKGPGKAP